MADISQYLQAIMSAVYGEDVRGSIHDAIEIINDVSEVVLSTGTAVDSATSSSSGYYTGSLYLNTSTYELWKCVGTNSWFSLGILKGDDGETGVGIASVTKTGQSGLVDTYTITYTNGNTSNFTITNGANGTDGEDGTDGVSVTGVSLIGKVGLISTYRMTFSNNTYFDYEVSDGASGTGTGDMLKSVYDTNNNGIVDACESITNATAAFTEAGTRSNIATGESAATIFGKIKKFFTDLKTVAFTGSYTDLSNQPTIPTITDTYSGTSSNGMSGKAVKSAIDALDGTITGSAGASKTLTGFSQTDGKVSATFGDISITKSQISDFPAIPTVNNGTFNVQQNGTTKGSSTANQSGTTTANIVTDEFKATTTTVSSGSFSFTGLDDTKGWAYKPYVSITGSSANKNPSAQISSISGAGTASMSVTYTTDADEGATVKLRIIK